MRTSVFRPAAALGLLAMLAACGTAPPGLPKLPVSADTPAAPLAVRAPVAPPSSFPSDKDSGQASLPVPDEQPGDYLSGGETFREFQRGQASWYGPRFHGRRTASGERFDMGGLTAAHRSLPFGTLVRVRSLVNGREVELRINDRGPYSGDRIIDVSRAAAEELGMLGLGFKQVVLLVPASLPDLALPEPLPPRKPLRPVRRAAAAKKR
jgi:rare lipoprotein A